MMFVVLLLVVLSESQSWINQLIC